jgi:cob(I)alamin adenosyltransferase
MGHRLTKIYTRTGDDGSTGLADGTRTAKDSARIEAIGEIDELNSLIGMVLSLEPGESVESCLIDIQHDLFNLGAELSLPGNAMLTPHDVKRLERILDGFNKDLPPLKEFILPGGGAAAATCHLARSVCRRAERSLVSLSHSERVGGDALRFLNRLSDLLFVICRVLARKSSAGEIYWRSKGRGNEK